MVNINELTIGQVKELSNLISLQVNVEKNDLFSRYIGKYVICRSRNEGVNAGKVLALDETGVILEDARRLYYHKPIDKNTSWYEGIAKTGLSKDSKISAAVEKIIVEDYSLTVCTDDAEKSIRGAKDNVQS